MARLDGREERPEVVGGRGLLAVREDWGRAGVSSGGGTTHSFLTLQTSQEFK